MARGETPAGHRVGGRGREKRRLRSLLLPLPLLARLEGRLVGAAAVIAISLCLCPLRLLKRVG